MEQLSSLQPPAKSAEKGPTGSSAMEAAFTGNPVTLILNYESSNQATSREIGQSGDIQKGSHKVAWGEDQSDRSKMSGEELASDRSQSSEGKASPSAKAANRIGGEAGVDQSGQRLVLQGMEEEETEALWLGVEQLLVSKLESVQGMLEDYGIGEGDEDSESEEGLLWKAVEKTRMAADLASVV